jgi:O-antigen/teichoic acid export membrane protein
MTVVNLSNPFVLGIGQVLTPLIAQAFSEKGPQELKRVVLKATIFLGIVLTCFCIGALLFGDEVVKIIYGGEFTDNRWTIFLLAVVALVSALSMPPGFGLLALERPEVNLKASIIGVVITVAAVSTLIFHFKLLGVAGGLLCGFMSILAVHWIVFGRTVAKASINR